MVSRKDQYGDELQTVLICYSWLLWIFCIVAGLPTVQQPRMVLLWSIMWKKIPSAEPRDQGKKRRISPMKKIGDSNDSSCFPMEFKLKTDENLNMKYADFLFEISFRVQGRRLGEG
ncbi:uncharacterized protein LOC132614511 [Lycium barbarum]|uniref:uncharacterized protein LOC132614511 n=1 Tax=Lycium barbarum TaxID=112863 RepID=UPI00293F4922|nr:uncharacterized protein LOC132614511 [Lycium barbarum]